jgi:hypothetical protein
VSLGQVPDGSARSQHAVPWASPDDETLYPRPRPDEAPLAAVTGADDSARAPRRTPWRWERLLHEAAVIGGCDRWARRLDGLATELRMRMEWIRSEDPGSSRSIALERDLEALADLRTFALPVVQTMAGWPAADIWGDWLERLEQLASMTLGRSGRVLATLADLRPMAILGPVTLDEVRDVLHERLTQLHMEPPAHRHGHVFVGPPEAARSRSFEVVFIPGLAERVFPQRIRPDPLLLDPARRGIAAAMEAAAGCARGGPRTVASAASTAPDGRRLALDRHRAHDERLRLQLALGAATRRVHASFSSMDVGSTRPRVPSFYALDLYRAVHGYLPDHDAFSAAAAGASGARLAWPAPPDPQTAIDVAEHDLATLRRWLVEPSRDRAHGHGRYLLELSPTLARSLRARFRRWKPRWSSFDGLFGEPHVRAALAASRPGVRPYSPSALQRFAACPYQFYLASVMHLAPRDAPAAMMRLDPLTRGRLMHDAIAACTRELLARNAWPSASASLEPALAILDTVLREVSDRYRDELAPPVESVWRDEVDAIRGDLRGWLQAVAAAAEPWTPILVEFGVGFAPAGPGRDPASVRDAVMIDGRWRVHGIVDAVEAQAGTGALRVTDYKTGRDSLRGTFMVSGGSVLQPVLYGLAVEAALRRPVAAARLFFCTSNGRYAARTVALTPDPMGARRTASEVLEIVDRALELGFLPQAPRVDACTRCDFHAVCGPLEERRIRIKDKDPLADLLALRNMK